jgi:hypothetical protein
MRRLGRCFVAVTVIVLASVVGPETAVAGSPSNDSESGAIAIGSLPFSHSMDTSGANANGPRFCTSRASVFYAFTPDTRSRVQIDLIGSEYDTTLGVYTREGGELQRVKCSDDRFGSAAGVRFRAQAGVTYFLQVGACCGNRRAGGGGPLVLTAAKVTNVDLEYAIQVTGGTTDPATGLATLTGTVTCNERSNVYREATLRQLREGIFVARVYLYFYAVCTPDSPAHWSVEVDTDTGIAFGPGPAVIRTLYEVGWDGWAPYIYPDDVPDATITLQ